MEMIIKFDGKAKINALYKGFEICTDQPIPGGEGTAPTPFDLFLVSLGTCAGFYVKSFCDSRGISTDGIEIIQTITNYDNSNRLIQGLRIDIKLPKSFPVNYKDAVINSASLCAVKRHLENPPKIETIVTIKE